LVIFLFLFFVVVLGRFNSAVASQVRRLLLIDKTFPELMVFLLGVFEEAAT
jgi:hypothetical protein